MSTIKLGLYVLTTFSIFIDNKLFSWYTILLSWAKSIRCTGDVRWSWYFHPMNRIGNWKGMSLGLFWGNLGGIKQKPSKVDRCMGLPTNRAEVRYFISGRARRRENCWAGAEHLLGKVKPCKVCRCRLLNRRDDDVDCWSWDLQCRCRLLNTEIKDERVLKISASLKTKYFPWFFTTILEVFFFGFLPLVKPEYLNNPF